jgi:hypothetical protein
MKRRRRVRFAIIAGRRGIGLWIACLGVGSARGLDIGRLIVRLLRCILGTGLRTRRSEHRENICMFGEIKAVEGHERLSGLRLTWGRKSIRHRLLVLGALNSSLRAQSWLLQLGIKVESMIFRYLNIRLRKILEQ